MIERTPSNGLHLRGDLQIETAVRVLQRYKVDSSALKFVVNMKAFHDGMPEHLKTEGVSMSLYVDDPKMKQDLIDSLTQELTLTNLSDIERVSAEELLEIQNNGQRGLN